MYVPTISCTYTHMHTHTHSDTHTHTHTHSYTLTHTLTHTHTYTLIHTLTHTHLLRLLRGRIHIHMWRSSCHGDLYKPVVTHSSSCGCNTYRLMWIGSVWGWSNRDRGGSHSNLGIGHHFLHCLCRPFSLSVCVYMVCVCVCVCVCVWCVCVECDEGTRVQKWTHNFSNATPTWWHCTCCLWTVRAFDGSSFSRGALELLTEEEAKHA